MSWHEERFVEQHGRVRFDCTVCSRPMFFPQSKVGQYKTCGPECLRRSRDQVKEDRRRTCETCGKSFVPRAFQVANGRGRYCGQACNTASREALSTPASMKKAAEARRASLAAGNFAMPRGEQHPRWVGDEQELRRRKVARDVAYTREYRKSRPEMMRESAAKRRGIGRLPKGTVKRIGEAQRWKCAICRKGIKKKYHMDHVMPLAKGGKHEPLNIQLLCPSCNVRKSDKHPTDYMQERGFLL